MCSRCVTNGNDEDNNGCIEQLQNIHLFISLKLFESIEQNVSKTIDMLLSPKNYRDFQQQTHHMAYKFPDETSQSVLSISISSTLQLPSRNLLQGILK